MALKFGLPKGSLQDATFDLFARAGFDLHLGSRSYYPVADDPELECRLLRAQEIPRYVGEGLLDAGICGQDWIRENEADVVEVAELNYSKQTDRPVCWVVAVANDSPAQKVQDLSGKRIATELVKVTQKYLKDHGVQANVEYSWGATEGKVPELVDAIVELTETGASLRAHGLRIVDTVMESRTQLIASRAAWADDWKRAKMESIAVLLSGALRGREKVGLKMNVPRDRLKGVLAILPAMKHPTVSPLMDDDWCAVETVLDEKQVRSLIPELKRAGAQDIIEYPLNKVIP